MNFDQWRQQRQPAWDRLASIVDGLYRHGPRRTGPADAEEMTRLYQAACADLARLRASNADPDALASLNRLITRAHGQIYRGPRRRRWQLSRFLLVEYPRLFRQTWKFTFASLLISVASALMAYATVQQKPEIVADIMGGLDREFYGPKTIHDIRDRFKVIDSPVMSSLVITNNIRVALGAFALGITFGLGTVYLLIANGAMLGGIAGAFGKSGIGWQFWMVILPHGARPARSWWRAGRACCWVSACGVRGSGRGAAHPRGGGPLGPVGRRPDPGLCRRRHLRGLRDPVRRHPRVAQSRDGCNRGYPLLALSPVGRPRRRGEIASPGERSFV